MFLSLNVGVGGFEKSGPYVWTKDLSFPVYCYYFLPSGQSGSGYIKSGFGETYLCTHLLESLNVGVGGFAKSGP